MPARRRHPPAQAQLLELALTARSRGLSFEQLWEEATRPGRPPVTFRMPVAQRPAGAVVWPSDTHERDQVQAAIAATRDGWRRAYEGEPPLRQERALTALVGVLDDPGSELLPRVAA